MTKASVEQSEEQSVNEETSMQAIKGATSTLAITEVEHEGSPSDGKKKKVIRKKAKKGDNSGKENISVVSLFERERSIFLLFFRVTFLFYLQILKHIRNLAFFPLKTRTIA